MGIRTGVGIDPDCLSLRMLGLGKKELIMEEKYTVTLICQNCGKTMAVQVPCGTSWQDGAEKAAPQCKNCKLEKTVWDRA